MASAGIPGKLLVIGYSKLIVSILGKFIVSMASKLTVSRPSKLAVSRSRDNSRGILKRGHRCGVCWWPPAPTAALAALWDVRIFDLTRAGRTDGSGSILLLRRLEPFAEG